MIKNCRDTSVKDHELSLSLVDCAGRLVVPTESQSVEVYAGGDVSLEFRIPVANPSSGRQKLESVQTAGDPKR